MQSHKTIYARAWATLFYLASVVCVGLGFYKMYEYENGEYGDGVNAYVGGDAYNYIINANYAGDFFILAVLCALIGSTFLIVALLDLKIELETDRQKKQEEYYKEIKLKLIRLGSKENSKENDQQTRE